MFDVDGLYSRKSESESFTNPRESCSSFSMYFWDANNEISIQSQSGLSKIEREAIRSNPEYP
jgi:hypothetical protein